MHRVLVISDWLGKTIQILHPGDGLRLSPGVTFTVAFESDDVDEVIQAATLIKTRLHAERTPVPGAVWEQIEREALAQGKRAARPGRARASTYEGAGPDDEPAVGRMDYSMWKGGVKPLRSY